MELATALIWTLRIVLPIILFCIYFKLQAPKDESYPGPTGNSHPRGRLLAHRKLVEGSPKPESMANVTVVDASQAPNLFAAGPGRGRGPRQGGRDREGREPREPREDRGDRRERAGAPRESRRERGERGERGPRRSEGLPPREASPERDEASPTAAAATAGEGVEPPAPVLSAAEEKMHLESLLNYVAFNRKDQQRTFLPDEAIPPPPPPKPPKKSPEKPEAPAATLPTLGPASPTAGGDQSPTVTGTEAAKANAEAQMVLGGAIKFRRVDVAKNLYEQLSDSQVEISEKTFALMIESCVLACDLKSASDFLMKMEASGHSPDSELLDKVMDLYAQQKMKKESEKLAVAPKVPAATAEHGKGGGPAPATTLLSPEMTTVTPRTGTLDYGPVDFVAGDADTSEAVPETGAPRTKLSSKSILFVPSFSFAPAPPPPPPPPPGPTLASGESSEGGAQDALGLEPMARTALKATSKAFQPQAAITFDPYTYSWAPEVENGEEEQDQEKGRSKSSKGRGKSGFGKESSKSKDGEGPSKKDRTRKDAREGSAGAKWKKKSSEEQHSS